MKIGIVIRRLHTHGGTERRTRELLRYLLEAGHEVHLFAEEWESKLAQGLICHRIYTIKAARWLKALSFALLAARATRKYDLDLVHSQARTYADDLATLGGACHADYLDHFLAGLPPLRRAWERNHPFNRITMALEKAQYRRCARLILNSNLAVQGLLRYFPWAEPKCRIIYNGVDPDFFRPDAETRAALREKLQVKENHPVVFLFVGSGFERKGLSEFLRAFALVRERYSACEMQGIVVGRGDIDLYRAQAADLGIDGQVVFAGAVAHTRPFYCAADVFVLPTRFDPYANVTNEALACGLPVITTRTNGASEILTPKEGFVVRDADDIEGISAAMELLLDGPRRLEMSANARRLALLHSWKETANRTLEVYGELLEERKSGDD